MKTYTGISSQHLKHAYNKYMIQLINHVVQHIFSTQHTIDTDYCKILKTPYKNKRILNRSTLTEQKTKYQPIYSNILIQSNRK